MVSHETKTRNYSLFDFVFQIYSIAIIINVTYVLSFSTFHPSWWFEAIDSGCSQGFAEKVLRKTLTGLEEPKQILTT